MQMSTFSQKIMNARYAHDLPEGGKENWAQVAQRVSSNVLGALNLPRYMVDKVTRLITERKFIPGGRYLYASGRDFHQTQNCLLLRAEDSREGMAEHLYKVTMASTTGAGVGGVYSAMRYKGAPLKRTGGVASGPTSLMQATNEVGRMSKQGGHRRAALWAGLHWNHRDVFEFITLKDWSPEVVAAKLKDFSYPAPMDHTNMSVILDDEFFDAYEDVGNPMHKWAHDIYWAVVERMCRTGEPGFSIDVGVNAGENCRNACTEITSHDDSDICNIGSINMARITSEFEMMEVVEAGILFLLAGTVYSDLPYPKVDKIRTKNRRLGLGLMGLHEWLLQRGKPYAPDMELQRYLEIYAASDRPATEWANRMGLSVPVKTRAIAPTGTIGIVAETTTGVEPIFCAAYKRRWLEGETWKYQYVLDPTAKRLVDSGINPTTIQDAYSMDHTARLEFQGWLQRYVDHGISSTINMPMWGTAKNNESTIQDFGNLLFKHLPNLRGITVYPDGARGGQPLNPVSYAEALTKIGETFEEGDETMAAPAIESLDVCDITKAGSCGA
jgi:ribonucleoside-diphosphate reductase alpha chain